VRILSDIGADGRAWVGCELFNSQTLILQLEKDDETQSGAFDGHRFEERWLSILLLGF
jgi:hypothetical protein